MAGGMVFKMEEVLADGVRGALVPVAGLEGLLGGEQFHEPLRERVETVRVVEMLVEGRRVELGEDEYLAHSRVHAVGNGDVHDSKLAAEGDRGFCAIGGEGVETLPFAAAEDYRDDLFHFAARAGQSMPPFSAGQGCPARPLPLAPTRYAYLPRAPPHGPIEFAKIGKQFASFCEFAICGGCASGILPARRITHRRKQSAILDVLPVYAVVVPKVPARLSSSLPLGLEWEASQHNGRGEANGSRTPNGPGTSGETTGGGHDLPAFLPWPGQAASVSPGFLSRLLGARHNRTDSRNQP